MTRIYYVCSNCGQRSPQKWGLCPKCKSLNSYELDDGNNDNDVVKIPGSKIGVGKNIAPSKTFTVHELKESNGKLVRESTGIEEFDRLLMGGMVEGQVLLIGAEPGFGKSTLCVEILNKFALKGHPVLYASGEESERQIAQRAERLHIDNDNLHIMSSKTVEDVINTANGLKAYALVVDSLQTMSSESVTGTAGNQAQSKEAAYVFTDWAKRTGARVILVSQFTKGDEVAGSNMIAHIVDTILLGESDDNSPLKFLRSKKNRYGKTDEVAVFVHEEDGLKSVNDPSGYLIGDETKPISGSAASFCQDGIRLLPIEVNALVTDSSYNYPQRQFSGMDTSRAKILIAALSKFSNMGNALNSCDVFANTINNMKLTDPMTDLAVVAAIASSALNIEPIMKTAWVGEVSLTGFVRGRSMIENRIREAQRLGFERIVIPEAGYNTINVNDFKNIKIKSIKQLAELKKIL